jgi:sulfate permease, SulP family
VATDARRRLPVLEGVLPIDRGSLGPAIAAGVTLAALGIPEVMGYTKIAGMPVVTGLYTILIPIAVFAALGSSRHLVVGADSATAAILAAGLAGLAATGTRDYVSLAGILAIMCAVILLLARLFKLGFLADFLSRSVLIGFLTGVGIQVAMGQVAGMLGVSGGSGGAIESFVGTLKQIPDANGTTVLVSVAVLGTILVFRAVNEKIPGALIAVIGAIWASYALDLADKGVAELGKVPGGLPSFTWPSFGWNDWATLLGTAASIFLVILAQSAATSRAYAAKYNEVFHENTDLVGLSLANLSAGVTGTFVVNGSPTKTQMVDSAGGRSQLSQLVTAVIVLIVLLFLTKPLQYMPEAVLASIVFLIGVELVDQVGMRRIWRWRRDEFAVAAVTALVVVVVGVEQGVVLAIVLSILDHLRASYHPRNTYLARDEQGALHSEPVVVGQPPLELAPGLVVYRFGAIMYYANAERLIEDARSILTAGPTAPEWLCLDLELVTDVDFSAGQTLLDARAMVDAPTTTLVLARVKSEVLEELTRYGLLDAVGADHVFHSIGEVEAAFGARTRDG